MPPKCYVFFSFFRIEILQTTVTLRAKRASTINKEYIKKCDEADRKFNNFDNSREPRALCISPSSNTGRLRAGSSWVVGPRGEGSADVHSLVQEIAKTAAERRWRAIGTHSISEAKAVIKNRVLRSLGITAVREAAKLIRERLGIVLGGDSSAAVRRSYAKELHVNMRREYAASFGRGPQMAF